MSQSGNATYAFERSHSIDIDAPAAVVFDYVTNPNSWPEWIAVSHHIDSPDRPLEQGDTFTEQWFSRHEVQLDWSVVEADWPRCWVGRTHAEFLGPIVVRYDFEPGEGERSSRFRRTVSNPARPKPANEGIIERVDREAEIALANIKANVERDYARRAAVRQDAVSAAMADIHAIVGKATPDRHTLARVRERLVDLAAHTELFPRADLPPPWPAPGRRATLYRLAEDSDHGFTLYANASWGGYESPAHNHATWAVIAGVRGTEINRFYDRSEDGGVKRRAETAVVAGRGIAMLPDDLHSIQVDGPMLSLHLYGIGLEQLHERQFYDADAKQWRRFPAHDDIRDASAGRA